MEQITAKEIKELRRALRLRQSDLAHLTRVTLETVRRWERSTGKRGPLNRNLEKLKEIQSILK